MGRMDELHRDRPTWGNPMLWEKLGLEGHKVNRHLISKKAFTRNKTIIVLQNFKGWFQHRC